MSSATASSAGNTSSGFTGATTVSTTLQLTNGKIFFNSDRDGNAEIYSMNADGSGQTRLTNNPAVDADPVWCAANQKLAFVSNRNGWFQIYTMNADGSGLLQITTTSANDGSPTWSPNGAEIAFASERIGNVDIYTMNADGSAQTRVTFSTAVDVNPSWSPDGSTIAFETNRDGGLSNIYTVSRFGGAATRLTSNNNQSPAWSVDGTKIMFTNTAAGNQEIFLMNPDGSNQVRLTNNPASDGLPAWSPDGTQITFESNRDGTFQIYSMNADGSNQARLTNNSATEENPTWSDSPPLPPANDNLANAQTISGCSGSVIGSNIAATKEAGELSHSPDGDPGAGSVWYQWTAPVSKSVTITTVGSNFDTVLAVYLGEVVSNLAVITKSNDVGNSPISSVTFNAFAGTVYKIAVDGHGNSRGSITFNWTQTDCPAPSPTPTPGSAHSIAGRVSEGGNGLSGVTLNLSGTRNSSVFSDANGNYSFSNLPDGGNYTITPSKTSYAFTPASSSFNNLTADQTSADFAATRMGFSIQVRAYRTGLGLTLGVPDIPVTLSGSTSATGFTNANGLISFDHLQPGGNYTVTPTPPDGFRFIPASQVFTNLTSDQQVQFERVPIYRVSGRVADTRGNGIAGVTISLGIQLDPPFIYLTTVTGVNGNYSFEFVPGDINFSYAQIYAVYPRKAGYSFSPILYRTVAGVDIPGISIGLILRNLPFAAVAYFTAQRQLSPTAWISTGGMPLPRDQHTATLLANGKVLVAGGHNQTAFVSAAELYDPSTATWTPTGSMAGPRQYHTATLLPNGKVLVAGNNISQGVSASAELYDPVTGQWTPIASMNVARSVHTANLLPNGKVLVAGGISNLGRYLSSAELYDPATGLWTLTGSLSAARYGHTATLLPNGKVLLAGGFDTAGQARNGAELYDPATGTWTVTGSFTTRRFLHTATLLPNGKVLIAGGRTQSQAVTTNTAELYDPSSGTWTVTGTLNIARDQHTATLLSDGTVLVAGGGAGTSSAELYDPSAGIWSPIASMLAARTNHTATLLPNEQVLVAGGSNSSGGGILASAELYDSTPGWGPTPPLMANQAEFKSWTFQGRTYAYIKLIFPNAGYRVANWGQVAISGNTFSADALIEQFSGVSTQAVTTTAQIYDLGPLADGNYTFNFRNSGTLVKSQGFSVSSAIPPPNPIDNARDFVRQQYRDFLNREADQAGEDFWTDNITKCADPARRPAGQTEAQCTVRQRETTSGSFFQSPEFQYTGYFVYRMYQGALGRQPKLSEFTPDTLTVANGIIVNGQLSAAKINQNKANFAAQFVNCVDATKYRCSEFKAIYDALNNQQYVDKLFQTTGVNASASDRTALVNGLNANPATETRASVLQKVVDGINVIAEGNQQFTTTYGQAFYDQQFNRAFVQLEYFGYMKRDPDEAGYAFWLDKLNLFGGNFVNAEMVLAFISSPEYRSRFGQP